MNTVIKIEEVSKHYQLGIVGTGSLSQDINRWWAKSRGKEDPYSQIESKNSTINSFWALKEISFEVKQGNVLGIIGRNGAGKSTLLKILSRVTTPTLGNVKVKGRIASLLEVGTGFQPELTGAENIFLNGAILGMTKSEVKRKYDEIVDFSGIEKHINTPVKRYSSGMYVRLAFAVAAYLESEILIIDEVLAVGDAEFQRKCLGKMSNLSKNEGRTVLFVSHNMTALKTLCDKGIMLEHGKLKFEGSAVNAVSFYQRNQNTSNSYTHKDSDIETAIGNKNIRILEFSILPLIGMELKISSGLKGKLIFYNNKKNINLAVGIEMKTNDEIVVFHTGELITTQNDSKKGVYTVSFQLESNLLNAGNYYFNLIFGENQKYVLYNNENILAFEILNEEIGNNFSVTPGVIRPDLNFKTVFSENN